MTNAKHPAYSQKTHTTCPRCDSDQIRALPANNPGSDQEWFQCMKCDHMWAQRRDRTMQGERPPKTEPPEGDGAES